MNVFPAVRPAISAAIQTPFNKGSGGAASIIAGLFSAGQQGFWLPFTDFASLSQDSAGTLPYTAVQQPVGRVLDRSGRGNNASQVTSTARGVVSARVNRLVNTDNPAAWEFGGTRFSVGSKDVDGGWPLTALVTNPQQAGVNTSYPIGSTTINQDATLVRCLEAKAGTATHLYLGGGFSLGAVVRLTDGVVEHIASGMTADVTSIGGGYYRITVRLSSSTFSAAVLGNFIGWGLGQTSGSISPAGQVGTTVLVRNPDYGLYPLAFTGVVKHQRVTTPSDYDSVGFPKYLRVEVDDFYTCGGGGSSTGFYYADVIRPSGIGSRVFFSDRDSSARGCEAYVTGANKIALIGGNGAAYSGPSSTDSAPNGALTHVAVWDDMTNLCIQVNGGAVITAARTAIVGGRATVTLGKALENSSYFNGNITEPIYRAGPPPNAYERGVIRTYQMQKAGML